MKNRVVGILIIGIAAIIGFIVFSFNRALTTIVSTTCVHGPQCPMWGTISFQTNVGIGIMVFIVFIGIYLIFFGKEERVITKIRRIKQESKAQVEPRKITKEKYTQVMKQLDVEERKLFERIIESEGTIFQSDLVEKSGFNKVKVTRILDRLEGKQLIERRRRGMTNVVILK